MCLVGPILWAEKYLIVVWSPKLPMMDLQPTKWRKHESNITVRSPPACEYTPAIQHTNVFSLEVTCRINLPKNLA